MDYNSVEILLVEDNGDDAELTIRELKKNHLANKLHHVTDGEEALEFMFAEGRYAKNRDIIYVPKLVLLDIQMPKVNGTEVLEKIKAHELTKFTAVVMLTSSKESLDIRKCYDLGANSYVVKPVNFDSFTHAIKNIGYYWLLLNQPLVK